MEPEHQFKAPWISVMVPVYERTKFLHTAITSVIREDIGRTRMQIAVVDDCSPSGGVSEELRRLYNGRVDYIRHASNVGPIANFNSCLKHAAGTWVHILHEDDLVLPGGYSEFERCVKTFPEASAVFARSIFLDDGGIWTGMSPPLGVGERGWLPYRPVQWGTNPVQNAGVLMNRKKVIDAGGFDTKLRYVADYNLWIRLSKLGNVVFSNQCVGGYRTHAENESATLRRNGRLLNDAIDQAMIAYSDDNHRHKAAMFWAGMVGDIYQQCQAFVDNPEAFRANTQLFRRIPRGGIMRRVRWRLRWFTLRARTREALKRGRLRRPSPINEVVTSAAPR